MKLIKKTLKIKSKKELRSTHYVVIIAKTHYKNITNC